MRTLFTGDVVDRNQSTLLEYQAITVFLRACMAGASVGSNTRYGSGEGQPHPSSRGGCGRGAPLPPSKGVWGSAVSSPTGVWGGASDADAFSRKTHAKSALIDQIACVV